MDTFAYRIAIWSVVTVIWGISFLIALKLAHVELEPLEKWIVIILTSLAGLVPIVGIFLAPLVAICLLYRMADSELPIIIGAVVISRFITVLLAIGLEKVLVAIGLLS